MSVGDIDRVTADQLINSILDGKKNKVKVLLAANMNGALKEIPLKHLQSADLRGNKFVELLVEFETEVISAYHITALLGRDDLLEVFLLHEIPVDAEQATGVTALHLAALGGHVTTIQLLCDQYEAFIDKVDTYGWSALHYACVAGHVNIIRELLSRHSDVTLRDQDGTTAAFRANICGRYTIVDLICNNHNRKRLLEIDEKCASARSLPSSPVRKGNFKKLNQSVSVPLDFSEQQRSVQENDKKVDLSVKYSTIRRIIWNTLDDSLGNGYLNPVNMRKEVTMEDPLWGIGIQTLRKILAEEFHRYKMDAIIGSISSRHSEMDDHNYVNIDELRIRQPRPLCAPGGPPDPADSHSKPLPPPRNTSRTDLDSTRLVPGHSKGQATNSTLLLKYVFKQITPVLAPNWKKLARKFGFSSRLGEIENLYPGNQERQALVVLEAWRLRSGNKVDLDDLTLALRSIGLVDVIEALEKVSQEITV